MVNGISKRNGRSFQRSLTKVLLQSELWERLPCGCGTVCDCVCSEHAFDGESQTYITHSE